MTASNVTRTIEEELKYLEAEIIHLENQNSILSQENRELEQELDHYCEHFNSDEEALELVHELYYDVCANVDIGKPIDLELLNRFFLKVIDKAV